MNIVEQIGKDLSKKLLEDFYNYVLDEYDGDLHEFQINDYLEYKNEKPTTNTF